MRVLVTGARGFVGSNIAAVLEANGVELLTGLRAELEREWSSV
jgi:nucleoside-diphosphate-sugar epimerase